MSEIAGSRRNASSGPRPNSSLITSAISASRSNRLSGVAWDSFSSMPDDQPADLRLRVLAPHARQPLEVQPVQQVLVDLGLDLLVLGVTRVHGRVPCSSASPANERFEDICVFAPDQPRPVSLPNRLPPLARCCFGSGSIFASSFARPAESGRQLVVVVERERPAVVQRLQREPVVARQHVLHLRRHHLLDVALADLRLLVGAAHDDQHAVAPVALAERRGQPAGAAHGRQLLVRDDDDARGGVERVERRGIGPGHVEDHVAIELRRELDDRPELLRAGVLNAARDRTRPGAPRPAFVGVTRPRKNASSKRCVFSSASTIEKRGSAPKSSAASPWATCRSAKSVCEGATFASAVATFTAVVVVPTPPLAPTNAKTSPAAAGRRAMRDEARDRLLERGRGDRLVQEFGRAGPHRFEQDRRVRLGGDDEEARSPDAAASPPPSTAGWRARRACPR